MKLKFKQISDYAQLPKHTKEGDAGMDLTITNIDSDGLKETHHYGLRVEIPEGYVGLLFPRSSIHKSDMRLTNSVGVIDSGYRGEIKAVFDEQKHGNPYIIGDRSAQLVVVPYVACETEWSEELSTTERGSGGYGSTGR